MEMAALSTDRPVQTNNLTVLIDFSDIYTAGIAHSTGRNAANAAENNTATNIFIPAHLTNRSQEVFSPLQADAMAGHLSPAGYNAMFHNDPPVRRN